MPLRSVSVSLHKIHKDLTDTKFQTMTIKDIWFTLRSAFLAGICIGIAGFGYLAEKNIIGAVLFSFGLLAVVGYSWRLYTGTAGFFKKGEFSQVLLILFGNILGCGAMSLILRCSPMPVQETAQGIMEARLALGPVKGGILAIGCGFIMTTVVTFARWRGAFLTTFSSQGTVRMVQ